MTLVAIVMIADIALAKVNFTDTYNMNRAYEEAGKDNYTGAIEFFDKEIKENPKNGYAYLGKAAILFEQKHYDEVITSINKSLRLLPKKDKARTAAAHLLWGQTLLATRDTVGALSEMSRAISIEPKFSDAYEKQGQVYYELKQYDLADGDYNKLVELNPADLMGYMGLGRNYQAKGQHDEDIQLFDKFR